MYPLKATKLAAAISVSFFALLAKSSNLDLAFCKPACRLTSRTDMDMYAFPALMDTDGIMMQEVAYVDD